MRAFIAAAATMLTSTTTTTTKMMESAPSAWPSFAMRASAREQFDAARARAFATSVIEEAAALFAQDSPTQSFLREAQLMLNRGRLEMRRSQSCWRSSLSAKSAISSLANFAFFRFKGHDFQRLNVTMSNRTGASPIQVAFCAKKIF